MTYLGVGERLHIMWKSCVSVLPIAVTDHGLSSGSCGDVFQVQKAAPQKEHTSHRRQRRSVELPALKAPSGIHVSQTFTLYGKRPLRKSVKDKLEFVHITV